MSYPNRQHYRQSDEYSSYSNGGGAPMDYSVRTPSSRGGYSQQYGSGRSGLDYSERTPFSQAKSFTSQAKSFTSQGAYSQGGYTYGGYTQGGYTAGGYTAGMYTDGGHTRDGSSQNGYTMNNSDRTPHSGYSGAGYATMNHSEKTPYSSGVYNSGVYNSGVYTERSGASNYPSGNSYYEAGGGSDHPYSSGGSDAHSVSSGVGSERRRASGGSESMSQLSISQEQNDGCSYCASTGDTTVAHGGRGRCPYQVEFRVQNQGKHMSSSKRVIAFRYGFANERALSQGKTGVDCRGEEHDVVITWSITGGKRAISMDGRQIQYAAGKRANAARRADILEASWRMSDHVYELKCHAYKPAIASPEKRDPRWKQYSLIIDGRDFFALPQIFDLGMKGLRPNMPVQPSRVDRQSNSLMSSLTLSQTSNEPPPAQVKDAIKSRIDQQRKLMKERKQYLSNEKKKMHPDHEKAKKEKSFRSDESTSLESAGVRSTGIAYTGFESSGIESSGVESSGAEFTGAEFPGVESPAPSELGEAKNRPETAPAPVPLPAPRPALVAPQPESAHEKQLTHHTGRQVSRPGPRMAGENPSRPKPQQRQIQAQQSPDVRRPARHALQHYQIRDRNSMNSGRSSNVTGSATSGATSVGTNHPPPTQQGNTRGHQGIEFAPQEPPTYDEITRDILGAYDGGAPTSSGGKPSMVPRTGGKFSDTSSSNAGESSIVPRVGAAPDESSVVPSSAGESSIVPMAPNGFDLSDRTGGSVSNLGDSVFSGDSNANLVPARANQKPSGRKPPQRAQPSASSSVDTRGVNKWGYF